MPSGADLLCPSQPCPGDWAMLPHPAHNTSAFVTNDSLPLEEIASDGFCPTSPYESQIYKQLKVHR